MKTVKFEIRYQEEIPFDLSLNTIRKYPVNSSYLLEQKNKTIVLEYRPTPALEDKKYIEFLKLKFIKEYSADSVKVII